MFEFSPRYFIVTLVLLFVECSIAAIVHDGWIRFFLGDVLVVIVIYYFIMSFLKSPTLITAISVLIFAYCIELLQYFKILALFGLEKSMIAKLIMGNAFDWKDVVAYTIGIFVVLYIERKNIYISGIYVPEI